MSDIPDPTRDEDFLAADYALGTLTAAEIRQADRRMRSDAAFAAEVAGWQARLMPMIASVRTVLPPEAVWSRIEAELPPVMAREGIASAAVTQARRTVSAFWRTLALGASGLAAASFAALLLIVAAPGEPVVGGMRLTAALANEEGTALYAAVVDPATGEATLLPLVVSDGSGTVPELWLIGASGVPESLGLLDPDAPRLVRLADGLRGEGLAGTLAVSLEPPGGSPTGQPTGPVVASGPLQSI